MKVEIPLDIVQNILKFCVDNQLYDKLARYGDFYYKLQKIEFDHRNNKIKEDQMK